MKFYTVPTTDSSFGIHEINDGVMRADIQCAGTSLATAAPTPNVDVPDLSKEIVVANYVDASNFGVIFPSLTNTSLAEVEVYAMGPNGVNITVFLPAGNTFVDTSVSINIPTGTGKKFMVIGAAPFTNIIGTIG